MHVEIFKIAIRYSQFLVFFFVVSNFAGCESSEQPRTRLDFWAIGSEVEKIGELFDEFRRENPDIDLRVQQIPWLAAHEKLLTAFAGDATPDVCQLGNTWIPEFGTLGALEPLDSYIQRLKVHRSAKIIFPGLWKTNEVDSHVYGIPWYADTRLLFYRKDMLAKAGWTKPPRTWTEWLAAMRDVKRKVNPNGYAILMPTNEWEHLTILGLQTGSQMLRDDGRFANFNTPEFRRAFEFYAPLFDEGFAPPVTNTQIANYWEEFGRGYFAMYITGPWNIGEFRRRLPANLQNEWATAPLPRAGRREVQYFAGGRQRTGDFQAVAAQRGGVAADRVSFAPGAIGAVLPVDGQSAAARIGLEIGPDCGGCAGCGFSRTASACGAVAASAGMGANHQTQIIRAGQAVVAQQKTVDEAVSDLDRQVDELLEKRRWMIGSTRSPAELRCSLCGLSHQLCGRASCFSRRRCSCSACSFLCRLLPRCC